MYSVRNMVESEFSFVFIAKKRKNNFSYGTALAMELVYQRLNNLDKYLSTKYSRELVEKRELPEVLLTFMPKLSFFPLYLLYIHVNSVLVFAYLKFYTCCTKCVKANKGMRMNSEVEKSCFPIVGSRSHTPQEREPIETVLPKNED